ncbi:RNA polymerase sigma factor [Sporosarcina sp. Te-1]|uniref:RNA polymerase sigma factor n=1 Tax=Sporosarcina sp. Te-1 TaxID=2818390 RepID=UPI001A9D01B6|nr:sigma-70 family RNA polymerase sigma factor [Sporosarcina sp. Te-1]QTD42873.1 sigma-70 family RNA polymerase sigma factor [Sporosarcina sp. Te-1]
MPDTIEEWFHLYERDITSYLIYFTGRFDVEDYVQETFLIALQKRTSFNHRSHPRTWLISIARNRVVDTFRRKQVWERLMPFLHIPPTVQNSLEAALIATHDQQLLYQAIAKLSARYRDVVILRGILEMSVSETARVMHCSENYVRVLFHRALAKLRKTLEEIPYEQA